MKHGYDFLAGYDSIKDEASGMESPIIPILQGLEETEDNTSEVNPCDGDTEHNTTNNDV